MLTFALLCVVCYCFCAQGVLPAGLEKVKSQELQEFITQCIAHDPDSRPDTRQLLKHPFFESIRTGKVQVERGTTLADRPSEEVQVSC
jgi:serine/threonine protein kinase